MSLNSIGPSNGTMPNTRMTHSLSTPSGVDGSTSNSHSSRGGKKLAVRVQMLDDSITMFQVQVRFCSRFASPLPQRRTKTTRGEWLPLSVRYSRWHRAGRKTFLTLHCSSPPKTRAIWIKSHYRWNELIWRRNGDVSPQRWSMTLETWWLAFRELSLSLTSRISRALHERETSSPPRRARVGGLLSYLMR